MKLDAYKKQKDDGMKLNEDQMVRERLLSLELGVRDGWLNPMKLVILYCEPQ